jgi:membrane protease YdiL (CAAX protease family)
MFQSFPEHNLFEEPPQGDPHRHELRWSGADLAIFAVFFALTIAVFPALLIQFVRIFKPGIRLTDLSSVEQVVVQAIMDLVLVGFIVFLVKVVHGKSFKETIHWSRNYQLGSRLLISLGATLAVGVLIISSLFPPKEPPPIEKLITSSHALYVFVIFGVGVAPLLEEIIFRGFLFKVLQDLGGSAVAVPCTAALFMLLHVPQLWGSWAGIALIFVVGYVLSVIRDRTNSLIPSLIIHMSYNAMLFGVFALSTLIGSPKG